MLTSADYLLDTSAAIGLLSEDSPAHEELHTLCRGLTLGLAGHALFETYSVLTRLPGESRLSAASAARVITHEFPASVALSSETMLKAIPQLATAGIAGGAVYDALVGLASKEAGIALLSCDRRAATTYSAIGAATRLV